LKLKAKPLWLRQMNEDYESSALTN